MYTFDSRIRYSETNEKGRLSLEGIINYFQDCTSFQSEDLGLGEENLKEQKKVWVLTFWQVVIEQYPKIGDNIRIGTYVYGFDRFMGYRNFSIASPEGEFYVKANSSWVCYDVEKKRPTNIQEEEAAKYGKDEKLEMDYAPRKIKLPKEGAVKGTEFVVQNIHLDANHHVNNAQYVRMAEPYLKQGMLVKELRVEYKNQAFLGDVIYPEYYELPGETLVSLNDENGKPYAVVQFFYRVTKK